MQGAIEAAGTVATFVSAFLSKVLAYRAHAQRCRGCRADTA